MATHEFEMMLTSLLPKMRRWAIAITRNKPAADDLVQDVAVKALHKYETFLSGTNFSAWIHRIMINHFILGVRIKREFTDFNTISEQAVAGNQQDREELRAVGAAYRDLSSDQRYALRMIVIEEYSYEEIAEVTGCAIGTLKSRVHRARLHLRAHMDGDKMAA